MRLCWASIQTVMEHCKHVGRQQRTVDTERQQKEKKENSRLQAAQLMYYDKVGREAEEEWMGLGGKTNFGTEDPAEEEADGDVARTRQQAGHVIGAITKTKGSHFVTLLVEVYFKVKTALPEPGGGPLQTIQPGWDHTKYC
ncbi:hypothetical protein DPEC_G00282850 [Dallia pectoralis]|uniref:Uncharacterized protein n=1 Tax=Dallia pectoralis TaxID=75939 RepID=A0ACC2FJ00_DALPE|nr:hypothetical protein DPEC_G00282850 [Dallia pectoralis]